MAVSSARVGLLLALAVFFWQSIPSAAKVFTVGDSIGWTVLNSPNYTAWTFSKTFRVGDSIVFEYNKQFHNVLEVKKADYTACNNDSALATYTTGNDSIILKTAGHHYYICGVPGHCLAGQKVDILVAKGKAVALAPSPSAPSSSAAPSISPPFSSSNPPTSSSLAHAPSVGARLMLSVTLVVGVVTTCFAVLLIGF
ncbi:hypothetical protein HPP92_000693 [Vanilla planifolia]|uniref:Phytocyanin domain-containing protein n=1 Tax=Vanilla planifolia TaxID=51239 RepID=A0A835VL56_VANPL|nr:hypothetical protein HPP92_000693 [Vanilla planifolia]